MARPITPWLTPEDWHEKALAGSLPESACIRQTFDTVIKAASDCPMCSGSGMVDGAMCPDCAGSGTMTDSRTLSFVISTSTPDRDKDVISPSGVKLDNFLKNPVVLWSHDYSAPPIGRALSITTDGSRIMASAQFADATTYPFADTIYRLVKQGFIRATSIGFRPLKFALNTERGGFDFMECELLEFSMVAVPANAEALALAAGASGPVDLAPVEAWLAQMKTLAPVETKALPEYTISTLTKADLDAALATMTERFDAAVSQATVAGRIPMALDADPVFRLTFGEPEPVVCRMIDDAEQTFTIDPDDLRAVVADAVKGSVHACVDRTVTRVLAEARGQVV